jgi:hypothetical protein
LWPGGSSITALRARSRIEALLAEATVPRAPRLLRRRWGRWHELAGQLATHVGSPDRPPVVPMHPERRIEAGQELDHVVEVAQEKELGP